MRRMSCCAPSDRFFSPFRGLFLSADILPSSGLPGETGGRQPFGPLSFLTTHWLKHSFCALLPYVLAMPSRFIFIGMQQVNIDFPLFPHTFLQCFFNSTEYALTYAVTCLRCQITIAPTDNSSTAIAIRPHSETVGITVRSKPRKPRSACR